MPNMLRRSMAYPREGGSILPGYSASGAGLKSVIVFDSAKDEAVVTFSKELTATVIGCGWTYSVNGGVATAPTLVTQGPDNVLTLTLAAPLVCADNITVSYDPTGCDLAEDGEPVEAIVDFPGQNRINTPLPVITVQPVGDTVIEPATATFNITATGATGYQWLVNGTVIPGANGTSYTTPPTVEGIYNYTCNVTNDCGVVVSDVAVLTVQVAVPVFDVADPIPDSQGGVGVSWGPYDVARRFEDGGRVEVYSLQNNPTWMNIHPTSGVLAGTPDAAAVTSNITVTGTNVSGSDSSNAFQVDVVDAPIFTGTIPDINGNVGIPITPYDASVHFSTGGAVSTYSLQGAPGWMSIDSVTGVITGTPMTEGTTTGIRVLGSNLAGSALSNAFQTTVTVVSLPAFYALVPDATSREMLGVLQGVGDISNSRSSERLVIDEKGIYRTVLAGESAWARARHALDPNKLVGSFTVSSLSPPTLANLLMKFSDGSTWGVSVGNQIYRGFASNSTQSIPGVAENEILSLFAGNFSTLTDLNFFFNYLEGQLPDLSRFPALENIVFYLNELTGSIPSLSGNTLLTFFNCGANNLSGSLPSLGANTVLDRFHCDANNFTGSIPSLSTNTIITSFRCQDNEIEGNIPSLSANTSLTHFWCHDNNITGFDGGWPNKAFDFDASGNALTESAVNQILIDADTFGIASGTTINLSGGTNAVPTGAGITAKNNLIANGATVITN